jgi:hypothetical protein
VPNLEQKGSVPVNSSCSLAPAAVKALLSPEFLGTFIATKDFEKRIKALHMLGNGQELLDLYVDNITQPLWKADHLVAERLTGESRKLFEGFSKENKADWDRELKPQAYYSGIYREKRSASEQQISPLKQTNEHKKLMEHMAKFVAPCTQ